MNANANLKNRRLLEALDYLDDEIISGVLERLKPEIPQAEPVKTWRTPFKAWKQFVALAACLILLSVAFPVVNYILPRIGISMGSWGGYNEESSEILSSQVTTSVEESLYSISQTELDEINAAYAKKYGKGRRVSNNCDEVNYWYPCLGYVCIYEKKDGRIVFCKHSITAIYDKYSVAGYEFNFPNGSELIVYKDHEIYSVYSAYENGLLTEDEVRELSEIHHEHLYGENKYG